MRPRLGAAILAAALIPLTAVTTARPATAGGDITPPAVGDCHDLSYNEHLAWTDPDPAVDCSEQHTARTIAVVEPSEAPAWRDVDAIFRLVDRGCYASYIEALGGRAEPIQRSAYTLVWFIPTKAQRRAGARWIRCDVALLGGDLLLPLPSDVTLGRLPLPDSVARCRAGERADYAVTVCARAHKLRSRHSLWHPGDTYPGLGRIVRWTIRRCTARMGSRRWFGFYEAPTRTEWRHGLRYAVCFKDSPPAERVN